MPKDACRPALWHKDAVIYEVHVKTFYDSNGDGIGDFVGLIQKLDYVQQLGVTCLWLLPFYESPLRDDGYDISHYERIDPRYGTLDDFTRFLDEAHARGISVVTELVINHTSDAHPWFQAARRAPEGSAKRNFYVWSDTTERFQDARIIFGDVEPSNWTWDPVARAFFWHRFFRHQPDLNLDNPHVRRAVLKVMRFWLDKGVDGFRLDAVAHLFERDGTTCDNLPETHRFLKKIRSDIERRYPQRILLAEVNQRPDDMRPYFGNGDECQMVFHFPLMPRLFMALAREDAHPVIDMVEQSNNLPATCQWALFLRNHDELTLSAVPEEDRTYLMNAYARDPRAYLNHGIRRRLAPLLAGEPSRLKLAHALLCSLPGSPVIYYGDELGMGDNLQLGDRDGVRTPMQWSAAPNGGFSSAPADRLVAPPIDDAADGYRHLNVEAQDRDPGSLLAAMRRLLHTRRRHQVFGRGTIEFLDTGNRRVLAFLRRYGTDTILVVLNLARSPQLASIVLPPGLAGLSATDLLSATPFPPTTESAYGVTLGADAYAWLSLGGGTVAPTEESGDG